MKLNSFFNGYSIFRRLAIFLLCSILICSSCNNSTPDVSARKTAIKSWVALDIKFKSNSSPEARQRSINTVIRILTDTIDAMRKDGYFKDAPKIVSTQDPYNDPSSAKIKVDFSLRKLPIAAPQDTTKGPTCLCSNGCKICSTIISKINIPPDDAIESVNDYNEPEN
ncbi:MAG TPA: hypothetical protein VIH86_17300 [Puia sp.]|jgi:hypothetical protein